MKKSNSGKQPAQNLRKLIKQELKPKQLKFLDTAFVQALSTAGSFNRWTPPALGTNTYNRVTDQINIDHIHIRMVSYYGDAIGNPIRAVLIQTAGGFIPTALNQIFSLGSSGAEDFTSDYKPFIVGKQIRILYDSLYSCVPNASTAVKCQTLKLKPKMRLVEFEQSTTTNTNGDLYWIFISDSLVIPHPVVDMLMRVYYTDV